MRVLKLDDELLCLMSYVKISEYRLKVMSVLCRDDVDMPSRIAKRVNILPNHISKVLRELVDADLIECVNPDARKGRLYRLTELGSVVKEGITGDFVRYSLFDDDGGGFRVKDNVSGVVISDVSVLVDLLNELS